MTVRDWNQWPAQELPPDFASRTADVLLQLDANVVEPEAKVVPLRRRRLWVGVLALAAALAAGTSWAMIHQGVFRTPELAVVSEPLPSASTAIATKPTVPASVHQFIEAEPEPAQPVRVVVSPPPAAPPPASAPASASAPPKVIVVPRCNCEPGAYMCSCVN